MYKIVELQLSDIKVRLEDHGLKISLTKKAGEWLAKEGYDPSFGARPLQRTLQKYIESPLSVKILSKEFKEGDSVQIDLDEKDEAIVFKKK